MASAAAALAPKALALCDQARFDTEEQLEVEKLAGTRGLTLSELAALFTSGVLKLSLEVKPNPGGISKSGFQLWTKTPMNVPRSFWLHNVFFPYSIRASGVPSHAKVEDGVATGFKASDKLSLCVHLKRARFTEAVAATRAIEGTFFKAISDNRQAIWADKRAHASAETPADVEALFKGGSMVRTVDPEADFDVVYLDIPNWGNYIDHADVSTASVHGEEVHTVLNTTFAPRPPLNPMRKNIPTAFGVLVGNLIGCDGGTVLTSVPMTTSGLLGDGPIIYEEKTDKPMLRAVGPSDLTEGSYGSVLVTIVGVNFKSGHTPDIKVKLTAAAVVLTERAPPGASAAVAAPAAGSAAESAANEAAAKRAAKLAAAIEQLSGSASAGVKRGREEALTHSTVSSWAAGSAAMAEAFAPGTSTAV